MLKINNRLEIPLRELDFTFVRSSGPGGQNVNKVNTKAVLSWIVEDNSSLPEDVLERFVKRYSRRISNEGKLKITSQRFRDRGRNIADCLNKLRDMVLSVAEKPKKRKATKPSKGSKERRLKNKQRNSQKKQLRRRVDDS